MFYKHIKHIKTKKTYACYDKFGQTDIAASFFVQKRINCSCYNENKNEFKKQNDLLMEVKSKDET
jgi:hypothetical protein